jgi:Flp pilus assembly protein TadD
MICVLMLATGLSACQSTPNAASQLDESRSVSEAEFSGGSKRAPTPRTLYAMSRMYAARGMDAQCRMLLEQILREDRTFVPAYSDMAELQVRQAQVGDAIATLHKALEIAPKDPVVMNNLGMCHLVRGDYAQALLYFELSTERSPKVARYQANRAAALGLLGRYDEALAVYRQILPEAQAHHNLGVLCRARQDHERATLEFGLAQAAGGELPQ